VELGDKSTYPVEGFGQASVKLESGNHVHLSNVLYVPGLEKNLVSISCLEDKGNRIAFMDGKVLSWHKNSSIEDARVIGSREGNLYRLLEQNEEALVHDEVNPNELWHRRYAHINYQALPFLRKMVEGIPELKSTHEGICKGCALGKNIKKPFPSSNNRSKEILDLIHSDVCSPMPVKSLGGSLSYVTVLPEASPPPPALFEAPKLDPGGCVQEAWAEARFGALEHASCHFRSIPLRRALHARF
jgi:hypothetical protein